MRGVEAAALLRSRGAAGFAVAARGRATRADEVAGLVRFLAVIDVAVVKVRLRWLARTADRNLNGTYAVTDVFTKDQGRWRASWRISVRLTDR